MNHLVLLKKIAICWKLLTTMVLELINSVTIHSFEQSAGNQQISNILVGSSETTRDPYVSNNIRRYSPLNYTLKFKNNSINYNKTIIRQYSTHKEFASFATEDNIKNINFINTYTNFKDRSQILKELKDK
uniref:hypothetical protein n=1 Tax=Cordyceps blackwelliae TaxID=2164018 RepID=UPI002237A378|nr:hypothetical protein OQ115_mgp12 [Cordyceps blackwelliae]UYS92295.1 hypothetical protein [Cordyceps blackwelliae]